MQGHSCRIAPMLHKLTPISATAILFVVLYVLAGASQFVGDAGIWPASFIYSQVITNDEFSFAELTSALVWLAAAALFLSAFWRLNWRRVAWPLRLWLLFYLILSIFAFGEEISWGDHYFDYASELKTSSINFQEETNLHNLNLASLLNISPDNQFYTQLLNATHILNPLFYIVIFIIWVLLPLALQHGYGARSQWLQLMPRTSPAYQRLFLCQLLVYLAVDQFWFNVGHIFEFFVAFAALLAALEVAAAGRSLSAPASQPVEE